MINLFMPLTMLIFTLIVLFIIIIYNNKIYYSYYDYSVDKLIKLHPSKIIKLYLVRVAIQLQYKFH